MDIDYDNIKNIVKVKIYPFNSRDSQLISFELSYKRYNGDFQTLLCPTYRSKIEPVLRQLERRHLLQHGRYKKLHDDLKSLEATLSENSALRRIS